MPISFEEVMAFHPDNQYVYEEIRDYLGQLLPFVGAGLTADVYGTWRSTLEALGAKLTDEQKKRDFQALMDAGKYLESAQLLMETRRSLNLAKDLAHHFSRKKLEDMWSKVQQGALWLLPDLFACPVLTTNFDEAIETVYPRKGFVPFNAFDPTNAYLRSHAARLRRTPCVFKLHGTVSDDMVDCETLVLTSKQYQHHYDEKHEVRDALRSFIDQRSMLFLGCSLGIDRTVDVLKDAACSGTVHYAIVEAQMNNLDKRIGSLADAGIRAIVYQNEQHDSVRAVLQQLIDDKGIEPKGGGVPRKPRTTAAPVVTMPSAVPLAKLVERINARLERQRKGHPSFRLMGDGFSRELLPGGVESDGSEEIPNSARRVRLDDDKVVSFRDFFQQSWDLSDQAHLFITGQGGVGKTVALLSFATEEVFLPKGVPAIYIPLYDLAQYADKRRDCIDEYLGRAYGPDEREVIQRLSHEPWSKGPNVILLLDGHNEVPVDRRRDVNEGIRAWAERAGTQLVTTSRVAGLFGVANTRCLELQGLSKKEVATYLQGHGIRRPAKFEHRLWQLLQTPLMLRIYAGVETFPKELRRPYLRFEPSNNAGHLVWNYLQRELWRCVEHGSGFAGSAYAFALLLTLPYVCWRMESAHEFKISAHTLGVYVHEACARWHHAGKPAHFVEVEKALHSFSSQVGAKELESSQLAILAEETGLLAWNGDGYSLAHQSVRDALAAVHLCNTMEAPYDKLPQEYRRPISEYVKDFVADLAKDCPKENNRPLLGLWNTNRAENPTDVVAAHNLLRIIHKHFGGNLSMLNWSGMDTQGMYLFPFRHGIHLDLSPSADSFDHTAFDAKCFRPQGHGGPVLSVCFSPDGALIASGSSDRTVRLWDATAGRQVGAPLGDHGGGVRSVCFSPDGALIASGSDDGTVRLWDAATGRQAGAPLGGHGGPVESVCFSPDGALVAGGSSDRTVRLWDAATGRQVGAPLGGHGGPVESVCFSPDGALIASGSDDGTVRLWDAATGRQVGAPLGDHGGPVRSVCFSPDGMLVASGSDDRTVRLWDAATGRQVGAPLEGHGGWVRSVCFSPDGTLLASGSWNNTVRLWDAATGRQVGAPLEGHGGPVESVCFSPDGSLLASGSDDGTVRLWDAATGRQVGAPLGGHGGPVESVCFSPDGALVAGGSSDGTVRLWDAATGRQAGAPLEGHGGGVRSVCFSPDGALIASGSSDGTVRLWDAAAGRQVGAPLGGHGGWVRSVCFSPDGALIASGFSDRTVRLWDAATGRQVGAPLEGHEGGVSSVCFSPDGALIASGSSDRTVRLWDAAAGRQVGAPLEGHGSWVRSVCFSPDGALIASGSDDGTVRLWDAATGRQVGAPLGDHVWPVESVCFSPDGALIASGSSDRTVRLWDAATGRQVGAPLGGHGDAVESVCFSPDGSLLASGSDDGTVRLWDVTEFTHVTPQHDYFTGTIEPLHGIDVSSLDFSQALISNPHDREILRQNGVKL